MFSTRSLLRYALRSLDYYSVRRKLKLGAGRDLLIQHQGDAQKVSRPFCLRRERKTCARLKRHEVSPLCSNACARTTRQGVDRMAGSVSKISVPARPKHYCADQIEAEGLLDVVLSI